MNSWPAGLPRLLSGSYEFTPGKNTIMSSPDAGPPKIRRRSSRVPDSFSGSIQLTDAQHTTFTNFWKNTIKEGSLYFLFPNPKNVATNWIVILVEYKEQWVSNNAWRISLKFLRVSDA